MWKWIVGIIAILILGAGVTCFVAVKRFTSGGNTAAVAIKATPERIFVMLSDADSLPTWSAESDNLARTGTGPLHVGDTLTNTSAPVRSPNDSTGAAAKQRISRWVVREMRAPTLIVLDGLGRSDSSGVSRVVFSRRDSLVAMGDSTMVYSTFTTSMFSGSRPGNTDTLPASAGMTLTSKLMVSAYRVMMEGELQKLKMRIEKHQH